MRKRKRKSKYIKKNKKGKAFVGGRKNREEKLISGLIKGVKERKYMFTRGKRIQ